MIDLNDLISRKRIRYELGGSTMPERYREFCLRVIDSERLSPTAFFNFNSQEDFTNKINELIALGEEQGFSTKDILNAQIHSHKPSLFDIIKELEFKEGKIDASKIKVTRIYREGDKEGVRVEMWKEEA